MGPLVPDLITNELNLVVALLVGIAFGFILEQAGFSSSRKLTGLFYGRDFTVLRVFFTAGATAMTGVLLLAKLGLLDTSVIYVNPTFLYSAIVGGLIMGVGFVVGGYCPGTSFCGAAVGRVDAMAFVLGGLVGVFGFGEVFPRVRGLYLATAMGEPTVSSALGVSPGLVALGTIVLAIVAFVLTTKLERKINPSSAASAFPVRAHRLAALALVTAGVIALVVPDYQTRIQARAQDPAYQSAQPIDRITADELAYRVLDRDPSLVIVDVRPAATFAMGSLPGAVNIPAPDLFGKTWNEVLARARTHKVFIADEENQAANAAGVARLLGYRNVRVLAGGLAGFRRTILEARKVDWAPRSSDPDVAQFRAGAGARIAAMIKAHGSVKAQQRAVKKISGGCGV